MKVSTNQTRIKFSEPRNQSPSIKIILSEDGAISDRIQILRATTIYDRRYGTVKVTPVMLSDMKKNFDANVRGIELMIDYGHNSDGEAAAWIKSLELSEDGQELWAVVDWTPSGKVALQEKRYRYLSADFDQNYKDNETQKKYGVVLLGAALTNRPVIKRMKPTTQLGEKPMDEILQKLLAMLGLDEGQEDQLSEKVSKLMADSKKLAELEPQAADQKKQMDAQKGAMDDQKKELDGVKTELAEAKAKIELSEKSGKFNVMLAEGKVVEAQRSAFLSGDMIKFAETSGKINTKPAGHGSNQDEEVVDDVQDKIIELSEKMAKEKKISIVDAQKIVLSENKELANQYNRR